MIKEDLILRVISRKFVLEVMRAISLRTMSYVEIQRHTNTRPVPLARSLKSLASISLVTREEAASGRVNYTLTEKGINALKLTEELLKL